jgi:class 3 adenylate cyclase
MIEESRKKCYQSWLVWRCWRSVLDREDTGLETSFVELLHRSGSHVLGGERSEMFVNFINRGKPVMDMVTNLIENGLDNAKSVYTLHELGARHVTYGVTRQDYEGYTGPFVRTVEMCARPGTINSDVRRAFRQFWQRATEMMLEGAVESRGSVSLKQAPKSTPFAIVFTDIEGSTALWENQPVAMEMAVDDHHKLVRDLIHDHNGYEVKTIGDSFMIAFKGLADAVTMALRLQVELLRASVDGLQIDGTKCEASGPPEMWNPSALRVRVGVHWCTDATPKFDVVYKRYDYYGNDVNVASRVQDAACGGQVVCCAATYEVLTNIVAACSQEDFTCGGLQSLQGDMSPGGSSKRPKTSLSTVLGSSIYRSSVELSGLREPITIYSLYPKILARRVFGIRSTHASVLVDVDEIVGDEI